MTKEQIIQGLYRGDSKAIKEAIKALEQEPILDKIRAEIGELRFGQPLRKYVVDECLEIIDKYKASIELLDEPYNENVKLHKQLKKTRKEKKRWKKKYLELRDEKKSIELARIEDGLGIPPIKKP